MAAARLRGLELLNIPDPTNTPSTPNCIIRDTSAGVAGKENTMLSIPVFGFCHQYKMGHVKYN